MTKPLFNPFSEYTANTMDNDKLLDYWCSPNGFFRLATISEFDVFTQKDPLIFFGGRGTGKTMFLRYFSYDIQKDEAIRKHVSIIDHLKKRGGIGVYLRFDGPGLRSFSKSGIDDLKWDAIFVHYFELCICRSYIEIIKDLVDRNEIKKDSTSEFVSQVSSVLGRQDITSLEELLDCVESYIREVTKFRAAVVFGEQEFKPKIVFTSQALSVDVAEIATKTIPDLNNILFLILIDEYENYSERQQRIINTMLKFTRKPVAFRIGMRSEGFHTYDTISKDEFLKEGRDFRAYHFESFVKDKSYNEFLHQVACKRLKSVPQLAECNLTDISKILGPKEDLEEEAREIVKGRKKHFDKLRLSKDMDKEQVIRLLACPENPLLEMLNIIKVNRGEPPELVNKAMSEYLSNSKTELAKKYKNDYVNKYKLTLVFLLASIYKTNKKFYSFNTFAHLSSGIIANFIELCFYSFRYAFFEEWDQLLATGSISKEIQNKAAIDVAKKELDMIKLIPKSGGQLYHMVTNLGDTFRRYHEDFEAKYPETNQFSIKEDSNQQGKDLVKVALMWSLIQKKPGKLQGETPGGKIVQLYTLNRIFSPVFSISYRTRGGVNESYSLSELVHLTEPNYKPKIRHSNKSTKGRTRIPSKNIQPELDFE